MLTAIAGAAGSRDSPAQIATTHPHRALRRAGLRVAASRLSRLEPARPWHIPWAWRCAWSTCHLILEVSVSVELHFQRGQGGPWGRPSQAANMVARLKLRVDQIGKSRRTLCLRIYLGAHVAHVGSS